MEWLLILLVLVAVSALAWVFNVVLTRAWLRRFAKQQYETDPEWWDQFQRRHGGQP